MSCNLQAGSGCIQDREEKLFRSTLRNVVYLMQLEQNPLSEINPAEEKKARSYISIPKGSHSKLCLCDVVTEIGLILIKNLTDVVIEIGLILIKNLADVVVEIG